MSQPIRTKWCMYCDEPFESKRSTARYCPECRRKRSYRIRPGAKVELAGLHPRHERMGGQDVLSLPGDDEHGIPSPVDFNGRKRLGDAEGWGGIPAPSAWSPDLHRRLTASDEELLQEIVFDSTMEFLQALVRVWRVPEEQHIDGTLALSKWARHCLTETDLTPESQRNLLTLVLTAWRNLREEEKRMELATLAAQQEELLAKVNQIGALQAETLARVTESAERLRARYPNDEEVADAVDDFIESVGA